MDDIRVLIADDDSAMRSVVRRMVAKAEGYAPIGEAGDGQEAIEFVEKHRPQVVFLDVEMPGMSGVECARAIQDFDPSIIIIFATAHEGYMGEAFEVYAFDYLVKPFKLERVLKTLERVRSRLSVPEAPMPELARTAGKAVEGRLMLRHREGVSFLDLSDILLAQREDRATVLYTADGGRYVCGDSLAEMEERLPKGMFLRCHKSYIINLGRIKDITPYGRWTYVVRLQGTKHDALITHEKYEELEKMFR